MSELKKSLGSDKILVSKFDAFRFPSSDMVQFRAMVTPCMPTCPPVTCDVLGMILHKKSLITIFGHIGHKQKIKKNQRLYFFHRPLDYIWKNNFQF